MGLILSRGVISKLFFPLPFFKLGNPLFKQSLRRTSRVEDDKVELAVLGEGGGRAWRSVHLPAGSLY